MTLAAISSTGAIMPHEPLPMFRQQNQSSAQSSADDVSVDADISNVWRTLDNMLDGFLALLPNIVIGTIVYILFWIIARVIRAVIRKTAGRTLDQNLATVFARLAYWFLMIIGLFVAITIIVPSMSPGRLVSTLGIGGVAIGFAFKDIFQNLLAGMLILLRQPFRVGDEISSGSFTGRVEAIETRATFIKTYDGKRVIIPNSQIYQEPVSVITAHDHIRSQYDIGIGYGDDIGEAIRICLETVKSVDGVLQHPAPDVRVQELAGSSVNLRLRWWCNSARSDVTRIYSEVLHKAADALSQAGVDMPFPTQVVLWHDQTEESDGDRTRQREGWPAGKNPPKPARLFDAMKERNAQFGSPG